MPNRCRRAPRELFAFLGQLDRIEAAGFVPALVRLATACGEVPALIAAYHAQVGPVPLTGLLTGLSLLVARHALVAEASTS